VLQGNAYFKKLLRQAMICEQMAKPQDRSRLRVCDRPVTKARDGAIDRPQLQLIFHGLVTEGMSLLSKVNPQHQV